MTDIITEPPGSVALSVEDRLARVEATIEQMMKARSRLQEDRATLIVFSGDMDRLMAAFIVATGAAAMGLEASMFFTYWGLVALKRRTSYRGKSIAQKMMSLMLPSGPRSTGSSNFNMFGLGPKFFRYMMKQHNVQCLSENIQTAQELGVRMVACQMSMDLMGIQRDELLDDVEFGGVATYLSDAAESKITLFV